MTTKTATFRDVGFPGVPNFIGTNIQEWANSAKVTINNNLLGKLNVTGSVTLNANTVSTAVKFSSGLVGQDTVMLFFPTTASAATEFGAGSIFISSRDVDNYIISLTHSSTADTDKIFSFVLIG